MKTTILSLTLLLCGVGVGCSSTPSTPNMPMIGSQLDRMGRAGVNTAATDPFDLETTMTEDQVKDAYNRDVETANWTATWMPKIAKNLAILDAIDRVCGNQLLAGKDPVAGRYNMLAGVLADDQLYVNTSSEACTTYLGVEANAVGVTNSDCGGRTPLYDTIQVTYSALVAGAFSGITSGVTVDADGVASITQFPFLATPN